MSEGTLLVSFGTTFQKTRENSIGKIAEELTKALPGRPLYQAYTSNIVRKVLKERDGIEIPDVEGALYKAREDGVRKLTILPTHIIDGVENNRMKETIRSRKNDFEEIRLAGPLLAEPEDYRKVSEALYRELGERIGGGTIIFMGHGSSHASDRCYPVMEEALRERFGSHAYIATVEGSVTLDDVLPRTRENPAPSRRVLVTPFMLVAGDHANNDMAGKDARSFASRLRAEGYTVECLIKGLGEYDSIREIYFEHARRAKKL